MRVGGFSAAPIRLSSNQLISSLNGARPSKGASGVADIDGIDSLNAVESINQESPKTPYEGPGIADLTPKSALRPPPGFFKENSPSDSAEKTESENSNRQENPESELIKKETKSNAEPSSDRAVDGEPLSEDEQEKVDELKKRDAEVVAHENAHLAAAGGLARGGPSYDFDKGPDGRQYRVGGHVTIDTSKGKSPEETIQKAQTIRRAALAPAEPSSQDRAVANEAAQMEAEARSEITSTRVKSASEDSSVTANDEARITESDNKASKPNAYKKTDPKDQADELIQASVSGSFSQTGKLDTQSNNPSAFVVRSALQSYAANLNFVGTKMESDANKVVPSTPKVLRAPSLSVPFRA